VSNQPVLSIFEALAFFRRRCAASLRAAGRAPLHCALLGRGTLPSIFELSLRMTAFVSSAAMCTYRPTTFERQPPIALICDSLAPSRARYVAALCRRLWNTKPESGALARGAEGFCVLIAALAGSVDEHLSLGRLALRQFAHELFSRRRVTRQIGLLVFGDAKAQTSIVGIDIAPFELKQLARSAGGAERHQHE